MKLTVEQVDDGFVELSVDADADDVERAFSSACRTICQERGISLEAFADDAQAALRSSGASDADELCAARACETLLSFAIDESGVYPAYMPKPPASAELKRGFGMRFKVRVMRRPALELSSYDPVGISVHPFAYDAAVVEGELAALAKRYATYEDVYDDRPLESGDAALISVACTFEGKPLDEVSCERRTYVVGAGAMPADFDDNIIGMRAGQSKTFEFRATDHEGRSLELRTYEATVEVHVLQKEHPAHLDDAWVARFAPPYTTLAELKEAIGSQADGVRRAQYDDYVRSVASHEIAKRLEGAIPETVLREVSRTFASDLRTQVEAGGESWEDFVARSGGAAALSAAIEQQTARTLRECYALDAVFAHEGLHVQERDILEVCSRIDAHHPQQARALFESQGLGFTLRESAERLCANRWIVEHAHIAFLRAEASE